jgi:probable phosphoglycerate mutase
MRRAWRTAELAGYTDARITDLLKEFDYGRYEGMTTQQIHELDPEWEIYRDGCPSGETPEQVYARANEFIALATRDPEHSRALAFSHGHFSRAVAAAWIYAQIAIAARLQLDVATLNVLRDGDRGRLIVLWNAP